MPKLDSERETLGNQMGEDGFSLLERIYGKNAPEWLRYLPAVEILRQVWVQQFYAPIDGKVLSPGAISGLFHSSFFMPNKEKDS